MQIGLESNVLSSLVPESIQSSDMFSELIGSNWFDEYNDGKMIDSQYSSIFIYPSFKLAKWNVHLICQFGNIPFQDTRTVSIPRTLQ